MSILIKPRIPRGSEPSRDDDPTGVRALLSSLPEPEPMPEHLVQRINASLAAEQAQRATTSSDSVIPLLATVRHRTARHRPARVVFAIAGAAAAAALVAVVGSNVFTASQPTTISGSASLASTSGASTSGVKESTARDSSGPAPASGVLPRSDSAKAAAPALPGSATTPSLVQISHSQTRYTGAGFEAQVLRLHDGVFVPPRQQTPSSSVGPAGTAIGLMDCLRALHQTQAQVVRADVASYEGRPAVIIVVTTNGTPMAYAVGPQCSHTAAVLLHPATPLP